MTSDNETDENFNNKPSDDEIIIIKTSNDGKSIVNTENIKTSRIQYVCNKCNRKYTTSAGWKRHLKVCKDSDDENDTSLQTLDDDNDDVFRFDHHSESSCEINTLAMVNRSTESNPYEFKDEDDKNFSQIVNDNSIENNLEICDCCGEDKRTAHKSMIKCQMCNKHFKYKKSFELHTKNFHSKSVNAISCSHCDVKCIDINTFIEHARTHNADKKISCPVCKKQFTRKYHLKRHFGQTGCNGEKKNQFSCQVCNKVFRRKDNLRDHLRIHAGIQKEQYICNYCEKNFSRKTNLIVHIRNHTGETLFRCAFCEKQCKTKAAAIKHERVHTGEKPFLCKKCGKAFAAPESLNRHILTHSEFKPHVCLECGKSFIQIQQLRNHLFHHTGKGTFKCKYCEEEFNQKAKLIVHEKFVHEGAEKLFCTIEGCEKSFKTKEHLNNHIRLHSNEKPYKCKVCQKSFRLACYLSTHKRTHKREAPRMCTHCPRAFIRADCLLRHMKTKHPEDYQALVAITRKNKIETARNKLNSFLQEKNIKNKQLLVSLTKTSESNIDEINATNNNPNSGVDIYTSTSQLVANIEELLTLLIDKDILNSFGFPDLMIDEILEAVIKRCGCMPIQSNISRERKLRENTKLLLTVVIDDDNMKKMMVTHTIDEVIEYVLQLGKSE